MRIIAGNFKGKKLSIPKDNHTRPLRDAVKESIFNILEHSKLITFKFHNSKILDLFSGVGTFGLECISRNSRYVTFFENYNLTLKLLKKNINSLNCFSKTEIFEEDVFNLEKIDIKFEKYELVFLDPPYKENKVKSLLDIIKNKKILKENGIILIHRDKKDVDQFPSNFKILITKNYGRSKIIFGKFD